LRLWFSRGAQRISAGSLDYGDDLVEARITAQFIPARIEAKITVCWTDRDHCDLFKLLERLITLASPCINEHQVNDEF
jgi:hypothetical protein